MKTRHCHAGFPARIFPAMLAMLSVACPASPAPRIMTNGDGVGKIPYFTCPSRGDMRFPVIIVKYQDVRLSDTDENVMRHFYDFFNKEGYDWGGATGSVRDYFLHSSCGMFRPQFDILGVVTLANKRKYYGDGTGTASGHPDEMVTEGVQALQGKVDFSAYDSDKDGYVDNVIVVYAGNAERFGASSAAVLPTSYLVHYNKNGDDSYKYGFGMDGLLFDSYTVVSELAYSRYDGLGTFLHEFSHALGLADLYNVYDAYSDYTPGEYDLMDIGMYNNSSRTPPAYSAFERYALGWIGLEVAEVPCRLTLEALGTSNRACIIPVDDDEFFILENRQQQGWDSFLPGHGLMVWHVDYDRTVWYNNAANRVKDHQRVKLMRPVGDLMLEPWSTGQPGLSLTDIVEVDGTVSLSVGTADGVSPPQRGVADRQVVDLGGRVIAAPNGLSGLSRGLYIVRGQGKADKVALR